MNLHPLSKQERAVKFVELLGGQEAVETALKNAYKAEEYQWVLELADLVEAHPDFTEDLRKKILNLRVLSLRAIGEMESNPLNRNYYFSYSNYLEKK